MGKYDDRPYDVGKGKPPRSTRWQPGQSGNPRGPRRRADRDLASMTELLADIVNAPTEVTIAGKKVKKSKKEVILLTLVHDAVNGTPAQRIRAFKELKGTGALDLMPRDKQPTPEEQQAVIASFVRELAAEAERTMGPWDNIGFLRERGIEPKPDDYCHWKGDPPR